MTDVVLVPGAWHGGWWYAPVVEALEGKGHRAQAVTRWRRWSRVSS